MDDYSEVIPQGEFVVNAIQRAMAQATPLTDDTVAGTESYMNTLADNDDLLLGIALWGPTGGACFDEFELCTIPRSNVAPYFDQSNDHIGTYVSSVRIGDVLYSTNPGEAFPEVNAAISDSVSNARSTNVVGMAGDMLGYYYQRGDYTDQEFGSSDFERFNVGPDLAQDNANLGNGQRRGARFCHHPDRDRLRGPRRHRRGQAGRAVLSRSGRVIGPDDQLLRIVGQVTGWGGHRRRGHQLGLRRRHDRHDGVQGAIRPHVPRTGQLRRDRDGDRLERQDPFVVADGRHRSAACGRPPS